MNTTIEKETQRTTSLGNTNSREPQKLMPKVSSKPLPFYLRQGLTKKNIDALYLLAHHLFIQKKYQEASPFFQLMVFFDHSDKRGWLGIAACCEATKQYPLAIGCYACAVSLDGSDPMPLFRCFNCYLEYNDKSSAIIALEAAIEIANKQEGLYSDLKKQALQIKEALLK